MRDQVTFSSIRNQPHSDTSSRVSPIAARKVGRVVRLLLLSAFYAMLINQLLVRNESAEAKTFINSYVSFELADRWNCVLEQTEWVCRTSGTGDAREAIIILTAKEVGPQDSLPAYLGHLKASRQITTRTGLPITSEIQKVEQRLINSHPWADGMHLQSEVPNYYTRYVATTKDDIAVLVTFSAHKTHYSKYAQDFFRAIESLKVVWTKTSRGGGNRGPLGPGGGLLGSGSGGSAVGFDLPEEGENAGEGGDLTTQAAFGIAALLVAAAIFLLMRKKKPAKKKRS